MARRTATKAQPPAPLMLPSDPDHGSEAALPVSGDQLRLELLRAAGVDADLLKAAVDRVRAALQASEVKTVATDEGVAKASIEVPNWDAVLRATDQLFKLLGCYAPRRTEGGGGSGRVIVEVNVPAWAQVAKRN